MTKYAYINFPAGKVKIKLLDTPIVELWEQVIPLWQKDNAPIAVCPGKIGAEHGNQVRNVKQEQFCVDQININIDRLNSVISGSKFPYRAFCDMSWDQTNRIHRCFTLGMGCRRHQEGSNLVKGGFRHQLTLSELLEYKNNFAYNDKDYVANNSLTDFFYHDNSENVRIEVDNALSAINKWVHHYEDIRYSPQMDSIGKVDFPKYYTGIDTRFHGKEINLTWDVFTNTGGKTTFHRMLPTVQQVKDSIPTNWADYDVFAIKSITGKDYDTCFRNYDNPLEYDIQNIQDVTGGLRIFPTSGHKAFYQNSRFKEWVTSYGLEEWQYVPVPIGKIVESDFKLEELVTHPTDKNTDGSGAPESQYRNPTINITSVDPNASLI